MGIRYDDSSIQGALGGFQRDIDELGKRVIERWQVRVGARAVQARMYRENFGAHFREDYPDPGGKLRNASGRLARSLQANKGFESHAPVQKLGPGVWYGEKGSNVTTPRGYSLLDIHEFGAVTRVTERSQKFFWAMYRETGDRRWMAMALQKPGTRMLIPARPVLIPAFEETKQATFNDARRMLGKQVRIRFGVA